MEPDRDFCIHCGVCVIGNDPDHRFDCPFTTGLWPVDEALLAWGAECDCGTEFLKGDSFVVVDEEILCVGCGALEAIK